MLFLPALLLLHLGCGKIRSYLHDQERFPPGSSGCLNFEPYEIFKHSKDDTLPLHVYHETYCGLPATVHYIRKSNFADMQKWPSLQEVCNPGYVLSIKALYPTSYDLTIVFTKPVESSLSSWVTMMKKEQCQLPIR
ncbi:unnamed protein product [Prunus armeniaca]|uniref:Wall-associated receptor kinase galacturonan-binding domain-containing protein n=1 Tax=Prunus armeniaca TaxID=36596 RepID=A0A6J5UYK3_PRUAR|nr:unnamed protein product [Prunus armeniaca]